MKTKDRFAAFTNISVLRNSFFANNFYQRPDFFTSFPQKQKPPKFLNGLNLF